MPAEKKIPTNNDKSLRPQAQSPWKSQTIAKIDELTEPLLLRLHSANEAASLPLPQNSSALDSDYIYDAMLAFGAKFPLNSDQKIIHEHFSALHELTVLRNCITTQGACVGLTTLEEMATKHKLKPPESVMKKIILGPRFKVIHNILKTVSSVKDKGKKGGGGDSNMADSKPKQDSEHPSEIKPRANPTKRPRSPQSLPRPAQPPSTEEGFYNDDMTKQQSIEMIARKEALHHVEMAWRAQQRLVRRCLGLRLFGETESTDTNNNGDAGKEGAAIK